MPKKATKKRLAEKTTEVGVPQSYMRKIAKTYSADVISINSPKQKSKIRGVFDYEGTRRVCVGSTSKGDNVINASTYEVVSPEDYDGETVTYLDQDRKGYEGMVVHLKGQKVVLTNKIEFVFQKKAKLPAGSVDLSKAVSALNLG